MSVLAEISILLLTAATLVSCTSTASSPTPTPATATKVTFAEPAGITPTWIFPIIPPSHSSLTNSTEFTQQMWPPLYWQGNGASPTINWAISLAYPPVYTNGDRVVTVHLRPYTWSNGQPVTARDVEFWVNLVKYNPTAWNRLIPGDIPQNIQSFTIVTQSTFRLTLTSPVSPQWFTSNQLPLVTPMPQQAWDKTCATCKVGNYDTTATGARAVMAYLAGQSTNPTTFAANPLWSTIDGPWRLTGFTTNGYVTFVANPKYAGPDKPIFHTFAEVPFTTGAAEFNALLAGQIDYGYIPFSDLSQQARVKSLGYSIVPWNLWGLNYIALNYNNINTGPIVRQLYLRQALESMVNQPLIIKQIFHGQGVPNFSGVPPIPRNPYTASVTQNPNPYNPRRAVSLLRTHGWKVTPHGTSRCVRPGSGASQCGPGVRAGSSLSLSMIYASGNTPADLVVQTLKSTFASVAGVQLSITAEPFSTVVSTTYAPCARQQANSSSCSWELGFWGGGVSLGLYPTGEKIFLTGAVGNSSHYNSATMDKLIKASETQGTSALAAYNRFTAEQVPVLWVPKETSQVSAIKSTIVGASNQNPFSRITPQSWRPAKL
ncbi:MAG: ABC transporter substrate-binding protein [Acidimicrobiales bacterium]